MPPETEDRLFAQHILDRKYATEEQVRQCLEILEKLRGEMGLEETLKEVLLKRGYIDQAQARAVEMAIDPASFARAGNTLPGYQLLERIGLGAMGAVYKARHLKLEIPVAIKVLRTSLAGSPTQVERLKREARLVARLNHPNIVICRDVGEAAGFHYLVMEYVDGPTARQVLREKGPFPEREALRIVRDVAGALEHAHAHEIIHRDVKPGNIMLTREGGVKLADFGLARSKQPSDLTLEQASLGTPQYIAPEQMRRAADATPRSDLFSLGASLYHLVTGRPPFSGETLGEIIQNVLACRFPPPESIDSGLGVDTLYVIHKLMQADPRRRYASATDLLADLERIEKGERVAPSGFRGDQRAYLRRRRMRAALVVAGGALVLGGIVVGVGTIWRARRAERVRIERCRTLDASGGRELRQAVAPGALRQLRDRLQRALTGADCPPGTLLGLQERLATLDTALARIARAEKALEASAGPQAAFRKLHAGLEKLLPQAVLPAARARIEAVAERVAKRSARALQEDLRRTYAGPYGGRQAALKALEGLVERIRTVYLDPTGERLRRQGGALDACRRLAEAWRREKAAHDRIYGDALRRHDFLAAGHQAEIWRDVAERLLLAAEAATDFRPFLDSFELPPTTNRGLVDLERRYFDQEKANVEQALQRGDATAAEQLAQSLQAHAYSLQDEAAALLARAQQDLAGKLARQGKEIDTLRRRMRAALARRDYRRAFEIIDQEQRRRDWAPRSRSLVNDLRERARTLLQVLDRLPPGLAGRLAGLSRAELFQTLDFKDAALGDTTLRGHLLAAEAFREPDPRVRLDLFRRALGDLEGIGGDWVIRIGEEADAVEKRLPAREAGARRLFKLYEQARMRKDDHAALLHCRSLLQEKRDGLAYTDFVDGNREILRRDLHDLEGRVGSWAERLEAGLPPDNFLVDWESGTRTYRFTFEEWWPHSGEVPPGVKNRRNWLDSNAIPIWRDFFKVKTLDPKLFHRAKYQLLFFSDALQADPGGGAVLAAAPERNYRAWLQQDETAALAVDLRNPLRGDKPWSLECTIRWETFEPLYFALTAGGIQAGLLYWDKLEGGGKGLRLFRQASLFDGLEKRFAPFAMRRVLARNRKPPKQAGAAFADRFPIEPGRPYRLRLEGTGGQIVFSIAPFDAWRRAKGFAPRNSLVVRRDFPAETMEEALALEDRKHAARRVFRFFSCTRFHLEEVVLHGTPEVRR